MPPESKGTVKEIQWDFGEVAYVQKYKRQNNVVLVGDIFLRSSKASNSNENNGQYGAEMLKFFNNNEMKTSNDRGKKARAKMNWTTRTQGRKLHS